MKFALMICLFSLIACNPQGSGSASSPGTDQPTADDSKGNSGQPTANSPSEKGPVVRMSNQTWEATSILGIQAGGILSLYFSPKAGLTCKDYKQISQHTVYVMLTIPAKVQKYDLKTSMEMSQKGVVGAFVEGTYQGSAMDRMTLEISELTVNKVQGRIQASSPQHEISGAFQVQLCQPGQL